MQMALVFLLPVVTQYPVFAVASLAVAVIQESVVPAVVQFVLAVPQMPGQELAAAYGLAAEQWQCLPPAVLPEQSVVVQVLSVEPAVYCT